MDIILASASPRRKELLSLLDIPFKVLVSDVDETLPDGLPPYFIAESLSLKKAAAIAANVTGHSLVIGADTIVVLDGKILGKPSDEDDAFSMLKELSDKWHSVISGVTVLDNKSAKSESFYVETKVKFSHLSDDEIREYITKSVPNTDIRFDGVIIMPDNTIYLPLYPSLFSDVKKIAKNSVSENRQIFDQLIKKILIKWV